MSQQHMSSAADTVPAPAQNQRVETEEQNNKNIFQRSLENISWIYRAFMTILVMFVFKLFGFVSSCFMTLPVVLPINARPSKDNKEGGPIIP